MNHSFVMTFQDLDFVLRKKDVDFSHGLGIVKAKLVGILEGELVCEDLIGVVNSSYEPVLKLVPASYIFKLSVIDEENVVLSTYDFEVYHIHVDRNKDIRTYLLPGFDFSFMGDKILKLKNGNLEVLFSLEKEEKITNYFHHIASFLYQEKYDMELAEASLFLPIDEENFEQIITYINKEGKVVAPYYLVRQGIYCDASMDIKEVISMVRPNYKRRR